MLVLQQSGFLKLMRNSTFPLRLSGLVAPVD
jgi:hypothetical protein